MIQVLTILGSIAAFLLAKSKGAVKSVNRRVQKDGIEGFWQQNKGIVLIGLGAYVLLKYVFPMFKSVTTYATDKINDTINKTTSPEQTAATNKTPANDTDRLNYKRDAEALATAFTHDTNSKFYNLNVDEYGAWQILKKYTEYVTRDGNKIGRRAPKYQVSVLYPYYKDATGGRSLKADILNYLGSDWSYAAYVRLLAL